VKDRVSATRAAGHEEAAGLIPWYVNETVGERDRARLEQHLLACADCREEIILQRRIRDAMRVDGPLEFMPAASLNRLRSRLDGESVDEARVSAPHDGRSWRRWALAASFTAALAAAFTWAGRWHAGPGQPGAQDFHTVTDSRPHPREEVVRAVFSPTITLVELQSLLDEAQLRIISGPTEAGVYSLAARGKMPVNTSLALLRRHAAVRFAESTVPASTGQEAPEPVAEANGGP
jgi:Putative zinc-finger